MKSKIDEVVTVSNLRSAAGDRSYLRGQEYFEDGAVHFMCCDGEQLTAEVHGTHVYHVRITNNDGFLEGECSCPMGQDGNFCKHLVALGLEYLDMPKATQVEKNKSTFSWKDFLKKCDKNELIKIILEMSPNNSNVVERYRMANLPNNSNAKLRELKSKVDELFRLAEDMEEYYDDYYDSYDEDESETEFKEESELMLKVLKELAEQKDFKLLWETTTYAIGKFLGSSNAEMDSVQVFVYGLADYFIEAVHAQIKPDDEIFRLFNEWEKFGENFGYNYLSKLLVNFPAKIRELWAVDALKTWQKYPPCKLNDYQSSNRERDYVEHQLLAWADEQQNDSLKLEIMEKKLCYCHDVLDLAKEYRRQGMEDKIIPLLEKGYKAFERDHEITDLLVEELQKAGKNDEALKLAWDEFTKNYTTDIALDRLQKVASKMKCWENYYQKVLDFLKKEDEHPTRRPASFFYYSDNIRQRRVEIMFNHGDQEAAWALAQGADLKEEWWLKLADWRSKTMPDESASCLRRLLEKALQPTGEDAYRHVVNLLKIYRKYLKMVGKETEFTAYCTSLRTEYKRRRLLMEQMNAAKL
ncbi:MAG: SWIM zinc finger family protein [Lentisphaeria bacterium]|nr:SWIM zinc finger family protein [Lentisphaeria bacterium]